MSFGTHFLAGYAIFFNPFVFFRIGSKYILWDPDQPFDRTYLAPWKTWLVEDGSRYSWSFGHSTDTVYLRRDGYNNVAHLYRVNSWRLSALPQFVPLSGDSQGVYGQGPRGGGQAAEATQPAAQTGNAGKDTILHPYPHHLVVVVVGGQAEQVEDANTGAAVEMVPWGEVTPGQAAWRTGLGGAITTLILPAEKTYRVTVHKAAEMPFLAVYASLPYSDGTVERLNYETVAGEGIEANAEFLVGVGNADKNIHVSPVGNAPEAQTGDYAYPPDYEGQVEMTLLPPEALQGVYENEKVQLHWVYPEQGNVDHVMVVRRTDRFPQGPSDGVQVYSGTGEALVDTNVTPGETYFYAIYSVDQEGQVSEATYAAVDTTVGSVYGSVQDETGSSLKEVVVEVQDGTGTVVGMDLTDEQGRYTISGLESGTYTVTARKEGYIFSLTTQEVTVGAEGQEVNFAGQGEPAVWFVGLPEEVSAGESVLVMWSYRHLPSDARLRIEVKYGEGEWETVATGLPVEQGKYSWQVKEGISGQATVRLEWESNSAVKDDGEIEVLQFNVFSDVSDDYWAVTYINQLYRAGITGGCATAPLRYCPNHSVTRAQMAVFLERGIHGSDYQPSDVAHSSFGDVSDTYWAKNWIEALSNDGITNGCGNGNYCPDESVTRAQMAVFLLRAEHGADYQPPHVEHSSFGDVADGYWAKDWIEQLAAEGITSGCGNGNYCPHDTVTRAQMAVFLVRAFNLP